MNIASLSKALTGTLAFGWILLVFTSASLLLPDSNAAHARLRYALSIHRSSSILNLRLRISIFFHIFSTYLFVLPLAAFLWTIDDIFYGGYINVNICKPLIIISVPRGGTTSFHRTLSLDERFVTPTMLELVVPFLCLHKLVYGLNRVAPKVIQRLELFLKWINGVTPAVEARHPIQLLAPDADDILLGEWHWISVGAVRTFPVADKWLQCYQMDTHTPTQRQRSLQLHQRMCQKILYHRGNNNTRLLLRSHLSPCIPDFQQMYPDATVVGILRDPVDALQSFAGLSRAAIEAATGVDVLAKKDSPWPSLFVHILSDMMSRESLLYGKSKDNKSPWTGRCHYVTFSDFKNDPVQALENPFLQTKSPMTMQLKSAVEKGLKHHETYKVRHSYNNPTLEEMNIERNDFLQLPGVIRYGKLLL